MTHARFGQPESVDAVRAYFDALGEGEWQRLETDRGAGEPARARRVPHPVHHPPGQRVLEIGAGPGRFTLTLARLGARITVTDLSPVQLELNARYVSAAGARAEGAVERRELLDVCDVSRHPDGAFDAVVALGGPLSYAFDRADEALAGLLRITRPGGSVVASVMSRAADRRAGRPDRPGSAAGSKTTQRGSFAISQLEVDVE